EGDGAVLIAGTGAIAFAEKDGVGFRSGGYGYLFGDAGSAFSIGAAAIERLLRAYDGRAPRDAFTGELERALGVSSLHQTLEKVYSDESPTRAVATLARLVLDLAGNGDRSASKIVQQASADLTDLLKGALKASGLAQSD